MKNNRFDSLKPYMNDFLTLHAFCFIAVSLIYYIPLWFFEATEMPLIHKVPAAVGLLFLYFSLQRIYAVYDESLYKLYTEEAEARTFGKKLRFILTGKLIYAELAALALLYLLLPLHWVFRALADIFFAGNTGWTTKLILFLPLMALFFALTVAAQLRALRQWETRAKHGKEIFEYQSQDLYEYQSVEQRIKRTRDTKAVEATVLYWIAGVFFSLYISLFTGLAPEFWMTLKRPIVFGPLLTLIAFLLTFRRLKALVIRSRFIKNLKKVCAGQGYTVRSIRRPYLSLLFLPKGENILLEKNGKRYSCKLLSALRKKIPVSILPGGYAQYIHALYFRGGGVLYRRVKTVKFGYESDNTKILILNPTPKTIQTERGGKTYPLDNGFAVGDYKIFTASAFLNALKYDSIEK